MNNKSLVQFWDQRYAEEEYAYGSQPNEFLKLHLESIPAGKILLPCEGEGRNAVFAAQRGWNVSAYDLSAEGIQKAGLLAHQNNVKIDYQLADAKEINFAPESFDAIALIYAHFNTEHRQIIHRRLASFLKPGGWLIIEAFNPLQLNNKSGGPKDASMLYTSDMLQDDLKALNITILCSAHIELNEGLYHRGNADVIRFVGQKPL
ncbi:MAG: class I SAM-dependent methyltransferase [Saprospiraceae bacterium]